MKILLIFYYVTIRTGKLACVPLPPFSFLAPAYLNGLFQARSIEPSQALAALFHHLHSITSEKIQFSPFLPCSWEERGLLYKNVLDVYNYIVWILYMSTVDRLNEKHS
ncbi:MAG: hypothetical protein MRZ54_11080 [Clostridiales bacterium]|nr:hypothetical protein [Clostridiales bacterium]